MTKTGWTIEMENGYHAELNNLGATKEEADKAIGNAWVEVNFFGRTPDMKTELRLVRERAEIDARPREIDPDYEISR